MYTYPNKTCKEEDIVVSKCAVEILKTARCSGLCPLPQTTIYMICEEQRTTCSWRFNQHPTTILLNVGLMEMRLGSMQMMQHL